MNALDWMTDPNLCGKTFSRPSWAAWRALVAAIFGLPLTPDQLAVYRECTQRLNAPTSASPRAIIAAGRGAGKTLITAFIMVFIAASRNFREILGPGELATAPIYCPDRRQARVAMRYIRGLLYASPMLSRLIVNEAKESIELSTGCVLEIHTSSYKSSRGYGFAAVAIDEAAFLPNDDGSANPDVELVRAVLPGLARIPGSLLLAISSPYAKRGYLWESFRRYHGVADARVLTARAPTRQLNPTIPETVVADALLDDEAAARSEWLAEFRDDIASFIDTDTLRAVVIPGRTELPPTGGITYEAFCDPAGGGGRDSFTLAVGHRDAYGRSIVDKLVEITPPFSPDSAVRELAGVLRAYGCRRVVGDRYGGLWPSDRFRQCGISYTEATLTRSELYLECLPIITAGRCELPDHAKLLRQFTMLERRTGRLGKDSVDHPSRGGGIGGAHDDLSNCTAGLLVQLTKPIHTLVQRPGGW